jgi:hypothetical protein
MGRAVGLNFPPYILVIHAVHLINGVLLWLLLRRLALSRIAAAAGALFFAFHMAAFDVYWKPMYIFDLLCGTFCLLSLLTYVQGRWIFSLVAFWIAYRAKEVAILLPVALAAYEMLLGQRKWKRLIPFFLLSACIGLQAVFHNQHRELNDYTLRFDPLSVWHCIVFYASKVFLLPYAGFAILLLFLLFRDRRVLFGAITFCVLLLPMLLLPGRLFSAYLYVPLIGLAIAFGSLAVRQNITVIAIFFLFWLPWNYVNLRWQRRTALSDSADRRDFVRAIGELTHAHPDILTFVYDSGPVNWYGTKGVLRLMHLTNEIRFARVQDPEATDLLRADSLAVVNWDVGHHKLNPLIHTPNTPDTSYIQIDGLTPIWQLEKGWYESEVDYRWTEPVATAHLRRPAGARQFELLVNIGREYIAKVRQSRVTVSLNGAVIGEHDFTGLGWQSAHWDLAAAPPGPVEVMIRTAPELRTKRVLGSAVRAFGFLPREKQ